ncbi:hypothetical protein FACS1894122_10540 [Alphaproteobacteria bacterium]|nr:hypothetical protein FACS1894122_10540 [Alphaproteobacteria bacterium]
MKKIMIIACGYALVGCCDVGAVTCNPSRSEKIWQFPKHTKLCALLECHKDVANASSNENVVTQDMDIEPAPVALSPELTDSEVATVKKEFEIMSGLHINDRHLYRSKKIIRQFFRDTRKLKEIFINNPSIQPYEKYALDIMFVDIQKASRSYASTLDMVAYLVFGLKIREFIGPLIWVYEHKEPSVKSLKKVKAANELGEIWCGKKDIYKIPASDSLLQAVANGDIQAVDSFLSNPNIDLNARDENGSTPLHHAVKNEYIDIVASLMKNGANPIAKDNSQETPLYIAYKNGYIDILKQLLTGVK